MKLEITFQQTTPLQPTLHPHSQHRFSLNNILRQENHHLRSQTPTTPKQKKCVYCKKPHSSNNCKVITDCTKCWTVVKEEKLCFNCLGHHKSSACQSKNRCHICKGKHHTSLCTTEPAKLQPLQLLPALPVPPVPPNTTSTPNTTSNTNTNPTHTATINSTECNNFPPG